MKRRQAAAALLLAAATLGAESRRFEKTIPIPRDRDARLDWTADRCSVSSLTLRNYPDRDDIEKAQREDPGDHSWLWWEFNVENRGSRDCRIRLWLEVLDKKGRVIADADKNDTVDAHESDDEIRLSTRMKTLDIVDAPKIHLRAEIGPK